jgi:D-glycero-D-manno-heptose 1,7-bisphosphate phosphatase
MRSGIFFERDGVLNVVRVERQAQVIPTSLDEFRLNRAALRPLRQLKAAGFVLLVATNQPGLSRGTLSRRVLDQMHDLLQRILPVDDILVCPHDEADGCTCRKPRPGLLTEAAFKWHLDLDRSFVVSDKWPDAEAARLVGCTSLLLQSPWVGNGHHDFVAGHLSEIPQRIMELNTRSLLLMDQT